MNLDTLLCRPRLNAWRPTALVVALIFGLLVTACGGGSDSSESASDSPAATPAETPDSLDQGLVLALAALDRDADGKPVTLPARMGILTRDGGEWSYRYLEDPDSIVFHKAMPWEDGVLTFGGTAAAVKLWRPDGSSEVLWEEDFGGRFSRMRDAEIGDIYGDGTPAIAVATHDQGVVAVIHQKDGEWAVEKIDAEEDIIVHEIELGDLDGDGALEIYATPTEPNRVDGTPQPGKVTRYVPAKGEGRVVVADLGDRHAKEILVDDVDGDGRDELYVSVEAVSGGKVEIRRYDADTDPTAVNVIATIDDTLCRFLIAGDVDGDGKKEMVAAAMKKGLWLLRPTGVEGVPWSAELIDADSGGFEHASILADLDGDGRDELYVASDDHDEVRRYSWNGDSWDQELLALHLDNLSRFTWNIMPVPTSLLPPTE